MSDQIILEFIGDPSGLKPAEEALKSLSKTSQETIESFNKANEAAKKFAATADDLSDALGEVEQSAAKSVRSISGLTGAITTGVVKSITTDFVNLAGSIDRTGDKAKEARENFAAFAKEANTLLTAITELNKVIGVNDGQIGKNAGGFKKFVDVTKDVTVNSKKLVSAMSEVGAEIAHLTGDETKANQIRERAAEIMGILTAAETVATTGQWALNAAMDANPIGLVVVAITALIAAYEIFGKESKVNIDLLNEQNKAMEKLADNARTLTEENQRTRDVNQQGLKAELESMKIKGASMSDLKKKQDEINKVGENFYTNETANVQKLNTELSAIIPTLGKIEIGKQGAAKMDNYFTAIDQAGKAAAALKEQISAIGEPKDTESKALKENLQNKLNQVVDYQKRLEAIDMGSHDLRNKQDQENLQFQKQVHENSLAEIKSYYERKVAIADKGSKDELDATLGLLKAQRNLNASKIDKDHPQEKLALQAKYAKDKQAIIDQAHIAELNSDKELLNTQLSYIEADNPKRLQLQLQLIADETALKVQAAGKNQKLIYEINKAADQKSLETLKNFTILKDTEALHIQQNNLQARLSQVEASSDAELTLKLQGIKLQQKADEMSATQTIQNATELESKLQAIAAKAQADAASMTSAYTNKTIDKSISDNKDSMAASEEKELAEASESQKYSIKLKYNQLAIQADEHYLEVNEDNYKMNLIDHDSYEKRKTALTKDEQNQRTQIAQQGAALEKQIRDTVVKFLIDSAHKIADAVFENQKQQRDNELSDQMDHLGNLKEAELSNTSLTNAQKKNIEDKYKREESAAKLKAWKADQKAKEEQALINGLLAFTEALATQPFPFSLITGAAALASAGVTAAIIATKTPPKFAKGVIDLQGPGTDTSDSIPSLLSRGESVMTARTTREFRPVLESLHAGTFLDKYMPIPHPADLSHLLQGTGVILQAGSNKEVVAAVDKLSDKMNSLKQLNINIDENGFTKNLTDIGSRTTYYNNRYKG